MKTSHIIAISILASAACLQAVAENKIEMAPGEMFTEEKLNLSITPGPFAPDWESIESNYPGEPEYGYTSDRSLPAKVATGMRAICINKVPVHTKIICHAMDILLNMAIRKCFATGTPINSIPKCSPVYIRKPELVFS